MTDELSGKTALVVDTGGLFIPVARRLARDFGRVYYFSEWLESFPTINRALIGDGFSDIERVPDPLSVIDKIDCAVFPDCSHASLQEHISDMDIPVWGSRKGVELELNRPLFLRTLKEIGLDVPQHTILDGIIDLQSHLIDAEDCYVKVSRYRGTCETFHWRSWYLDECWFRSLQSRLGPAGMTMRFVVCEAIEDAVEIGVDGYCVNGKFSGLMLNGVESKDKAYIGTVTTQENLSSAVKELLSAFGPVLESMGYRNCLSIELRVTKDKAYPIDFTSRFGLPSTASQLELWDNFSDIVWAGAHGELIDPKPTAQFSAELAVSLKSDPNNWVMVNVLKELEPWLKLGTCCEIDGRLCFPPEPVADHDHAGWLVALGNSPAAALKKMKEYVGLLPDGMSVSMEPLADAIKEIEDAEQLGIEISELQMPEPGTVLE